MTDEVPMVLSRDQDLASYLQQQREQARRRQRVQALATALVEVLHICPGRQLVVLLKAPEAIDNVAAVETWVDRNLEKLEAEQEGDIMETLTRRLRVTLMDALSD